MTVNSKLFTASRCQLYTHSHPQHPATQQQHTHSHTLSHTSYTIEVLESSSSCLSQYLRARQKFRQSSFSQQLGMSFRGRRQVSRGERKWREREAAEKAEGATGNSLVWSLTLSARGVPGLAFEVVIKNGFSVCDFFAVSKVILLARRVSC